MYLGSLLRVCVLLLGAFLTSNGHSQISFVFDPGAFLVPPDSTGPKNNGNARAVRLDVSDGINNVAYTYDFTSGSNTVSADLVKYSRWANGLAPGEGISAFNIFLRGDYPNVYSWGQSLKLINPASTNGLSATAGNGWNWRINDLNSPTWSPDWGYMIQWYTTDENLRIRPGVSMSGFSFTAPIVAYDYPTGQTSAVIEGTDYAVWFGTQNRPPDPALDGGAIKNIRFDNVWGDGVASDTFADGDNTIWNGTVLLRAVPEPSSTLLLLTSLAILSALRRRSA